METQNTAYEFIGLQMIEISSGHVTPARDAVSLPSDVLMRRGCSYGRSPPPRRQRERDAGGTAETLRQREAGAGIGEEDRRCDQNVHSVRRGIPQLMRSRAEQGSSENPA